MFPFIVTWPVLQTYNYGMYNFRFALAFYGNPTRPQLVALVAQVRCALLVYVCHAKIAELFSLGYVYDISNLFRNKSIQCNSSNSESALNTLFP
jgi:hypothetical protein